MLLLGPLYGLLAAIGQSVLGVMYRSSRVDIDVMGRVPSEKAAWGNVARHPERKEVDGILVLRLDAPLFWANAVEIHDRVLAEVDARPGCALLLDLEASNQLDTTSVDMMTSLLDELRSRGVELYLVRVFYQARRVLTRAGFIERLGDDHMWHSISAAVRAAGDRHVEGKAHNQLAVQVEESADDTYEPADERIAVESSADNGEDEAAAPEPKAAKGPKPPRPPKADKAGKGG